MLKPNKNKRLLAAAENGNLRAVRKWLRAGADANYADKTGRTPLHACCRSNNPELVKTLLKAGAEPDRQDEGGWTPLHCAAYNGKIRTMQALIEGGASLDIRAYSGLTPLELARRSRRRIAHELLTESIRRAKHGWHRTGEDEVTHTRDIGARELVEVFDFVARQRISFVRNLETGGEHQLREHFRDVAISDLDRAAAQLARFGGKDHRGGACKAKHRLRLK